MSLARPAGAGVQGKTGTPGGHSDIGFPLQCALESLQGYKERAEGHASGRELELPIEPNLKHYPSQV